MRTLEPLTAWLTPRLRPLLLAGALGASSVAAASDADEARFNALQRQLAQVQAALQQLAGENRALREHEREVDRKLAELAAVAQAGSPSP
ncbi:MAG: hypothetical protein WCB10_01900, partial [Steroidobacteraceae bacterium]